MSEAKMSDSFIGRRAELAVLETAYGSEDSAFIPIYGRRRVGKSELILNFMKNKKGIYFLGKNGPAGLQIREFLREAAGVLNEPLLASYPNHNWKDVLDAVVGRWKEDGKLVIVFDEFQWTAGVSRELPSVLQECWDRRWKKSGRIMLVLCGSYVGFMEREVLGRKSPLFGRRTAQILLKPFGFNEAAEFHPAYSLVDRARTYFVCGGVPLYLKYFAPDRAVEMNIADCFLNEFAPLYREPEFLLREELRDVENYYAILLAVATGFNTNRAISAETGIGERSLHYYFKQLVELGYLSRRYPLSANRPTRRSVRFVLEDPMLRFWFRFVFPNVSFISQMGPERAFTDRIRPHLDSYFGTCFERLCREALPGLYAHEGVSGAFEIGEYWDKTTQIDVVGLRDDGWTDLGECKWGNIRSPGRIAAGLEEKVARYPNPGNATICPRIFTRRPPRSVPSSVSSPFARWHSLADLYSMGDE